MRVLEKQQLLYPFLGKHVEVQMWLAQYGNGRWAIQLLCEDEEMPGLWEHFTTASVNMPDAPCPENEVWVKDWSENEGMVAWLIDQQVIEPVATAGMQSGPVPVLVRRFRFTEHFMREVIRVLSQQYRKQRGNTSLLTLVLAAGVGAAIILAQLEQRAPQPEPLLPHLQRIEHKLDRQKLKLDLLLCHTDSECENACYALGGSKEECEVKL